jgi:hemerythrin
MERVEWDISLETGITDIDMQHRILFNIVKILIDALENNREAEIIDSILDELTRYTEYHAFTEEKYHQGTDEELEEHRRSHKDFIEKVIGMHKIYREIGVRNFSVFILDFLTDWIKTHIMEMDMRDLKN